LTEHCHYFQFFKERSTRVSWFRVCYDSNALLLDYKTVPSVFQTGVSWR